jgi:hypothetical protein
MPAHSPESIFMEKIFPIRELNTGVELSCKNF